MYNKIAIVCAGDREIAPFLPMIKNPVVTEKAMLRFYEGTLCGVPVVALYTGVCKVNAAVAAQILIDHFHVDAVINAGTAGGIDPSVQLLNTVVSTKTAYHDVAANILTEFHPWLPTVWFPADSGLIAAAKSAAEICPHPMRFGRMVTGEQFITDDHRDEIIAGFSPLSTDMETAAFHHVCHVNGVPFIAVRSITDTADHAGAEHFERNCVRASEISAQVVVEILKQLT